MKAFDGTDATTSGQSNTVEAIPNLIASVRSSATCMFEDQTGDADNDFNDIGARITATLYLTPQEDVSTITLDIHGAMMPCSYDHSLYLAFSGFRGTGSYWGTRTKKDGTPLDGIPLTVYDPLGSADGNRNIPLIPHTNAGKNALADNEHVVVTVVVDSPPLNPSSSFDRAPFDTWIHVIDTGKDVHIFDPDTGEYKEDNQLVTNDSLGVMNGVYLNCALSVPGTDWQINQENRRKLWDPNCYPKFADFAKSYRTRDIKNRDWYLK